MLDGRSEDLAEQCLATRMGAEGGLTVAVLRVASRDDVNVAALANYVAFRLSLEGIDWWPAAADMQGAAVDPYTVARDLFTERFAYRIDNDIDRELMVRALH